MSITSFCRDCLKTLVCLIPCGSDQACTFDCLTQHDETVFEEFNACVVADAKCVQVGHYLHS